MDRRTALTALGCCLIAVAGCSAAPARRTGGTATDPPATGAPTGAPGTCADEPRWEPTVTVDDVELAPGGRTVFAIAVDPITSFRFDGDLYLCGQRDTPVQFGDVEIEPGPDKQADSCPPYWIWDRCTAVELSVSVEASSAAEPGAYEYGFALSGGAGEQTPVERRYAVHVSES